MNARQQALAIIKREHQTLTAVIDAFTKVVDEAAAGRLTLDYKLAWSILYYIEEFPDRLHHPKEETILFPRVRARCPELGDTLDELGRQHENGVPYLQALKTWLGRREAEIPGAAEEFRQRLTTYAAFHHRHLAQEETEVFPRAAEALDEDDWKAVAEGFAANNDPLQGGEQASSEWFRLFYRRIVALTPEPWGVGPRR